MSFYSSSLKKILRSPALKFLEHPEGGSTIIGYTFIVCFHKVPVWVGGKLLLCTYIKRLYTSDDHFSLPHHHFPLSLFFSNQSTPRVIIRILTWIWGQTNKCQCILNFCIEKRITLTSFIFKIWTFRRSIYSWMQSFSRLKNYNRKVDVNITFFSVSFCSNKNCVYMKALVHMFTSVRRLPNVYLVQKVLYMKLTGRIQSQLRWIPTLW